MVVIPLVLFVCIYNCTKDDTSTELQEVLAPKTAVSVEQAKANRISFVQNKSHNIKYSAFTYDYDELKQFVEYVEYQKSTGKDVRYFTVYLSQYQNGEQTAFIAPLKDDGTPNYEMKALNHGQLHPPYSKKTTDSKVRY